MIKKILAACFLVIAPFSGLDSLIPPDHDVPYGPYCPAGAVNEDCLRVMLETYWESVDSAYQNYRNNYEKKGAAEEYREAQAKAADEFYSDVLHCCDC